MWSIVEFDDGIMAVPSLWLSNSKKFCLYPPKNSKKDEISKAVRQLVKPTDDWTSYEVKRIFSTAATYKEAMRKESLAIDLTDCEDDNKSNEESQTQMSTQLNKGSNKPNVISSSSDDEDEDETAEKILKNKNALPLTNNTEEEQVSATKKGSILTLFKPISKSKSDRVPSELDNLDSNHNIAKPKVKSNESYNIMDKLNYIIEMQEENAKKTHRILLELKDIPKLILEELKEVSLSNKNNENENDKDLSSYFPLKTEEELSAFDGLIIENNNIKKEVIDLLARRGGKDAAALTNNILARVMVDELAKNFSFKGKQKKTAFTSFVLSKCIIAAVLKMFPEATEEKVELKIGSWLANAPFRLKKNNKKTEENDYNMKFGKKTDNEDD